MDDRGNGSFGWIGHRLRQDFVVGQPVLSAGTEVYRVSSVIPVVDDVRLGEADVWKLLGLTNRLAVGEALVWERDARRIYCHIGSLVHAETLSWRPTQIANYAILALGICEARADELAA
jgi:hypothetical protein